MHLATNRPRGQNQICYRISTLGLIQWMTVYVGSDQVDAVYVGNVKVFG